MTALRPILQPVLQPVLRSVFDPPMRRGSSWSPADLFANGEQGALYYFTPDFAGLYQDAAGTTPVTAVGQPVGLMLDRRFGLARGEVVFEEDWLSEGRGWSVQGSQATTYEDGRVSSARAIVGAGGIYREVVLGKGWFEASFSAFGNLSQVRAYAPGGFVTFLGEASISVPSDATHSFAFYSDEVVRLYLRVEAGGEFNIGPISVRELPGNHASQATTTARPTLRSGPLRIDYDGVDDYLRTVFPDLGGDVTIARSIPGVGAQILTGQTIAAGNWDDNVTSCATLVIDRALTGPETSLVTAFLNQQAGV